MNPINRNLFRFGSLIAGLMCLPVIIDVVLRLVANRSFPGVIEIQEFALVLVVFSGLSFTENRGEAIRVELLVERFPIKVQNVISNALYIIATILYGMVTWHSFNLISELEGSVTTTYEVPISVFVGFAGFGLLLLTITLFKNVLESTVKVLKDRNAPWLLLTACVGLGLILLPTYIDSLQLGLTGLGLGGFAALFLFILMLFGMPIGYAMTLIGYLGIFLATKNATAVYGMLGSTPYYKTADYVMAVVPMFMLMGAIIFYTGVGKDLFDTAQKWLGRMPGGLGIASVAGCTGFAAVSGDSMATAVTMGTVAYPEMKAHKYDDSIATGSLAAGGTLGILIPPSIGFILYGIVTEESIGKLFVAGVIPGLLLALMFCIAIFIIAKRNPQYFPPGEHYTLKEKISSLKNIWAIVVIFVFVLGGMLSGLFTPNEGGAMGSGAALLLGIARRRLTWEGFMKSLEETASITARLFTILIGVGMLGYFLAATRFPNMLADFITGLGMDKYVVLLAVCVLYLFLGCLMNVMPMILLTLPAIFPTIVSLGFDPIWFGVLVVILMEAGQITPPVGMNVFTIASVTGVSMATVYKGVAPFLLCMVLMLLMLTLFPQLALFLPSLLF